MLKRGKGWMMRHVPDVLKHTAFWGFWAAFIQRGQETADTRVGPIREIMQAGRLLTQK